LYFWRQRFFIRPCGTPPRRGILLQWRCGVDKTWLKVAGVVIDLSFDPQRPDHREKFNTYRFADYKEKVIDLLLGVTTVSLRTVAIIVEMRKSHWHNEQTT
jgi:hypothetical protein